MREQPPAPTRRVIVIGASNVAIGMASLIPAAEIAWGSPLEYFIAAGHGRALGQPSRVLGRKLPPILECQLWEALQSRPPMPTAGLVTDLGTDLVFGSTADELLQKAVECMERLSKICDRLVVTQLPTESVERLSPLAFRAMRRLLFPSSTLTQSQAIASMRAINEELLTFPARFGCYVVFPETRWYGLDPIHVKRRYYPQAWQTFLAPWADFQKTKLARQGSLLSTLRLWRQLRPAEQKWWSKSYVVNQPCAQTKNGSSFSLY